jgi:hypothetical protein
MIGSHAGWRGIAPVGALGVSLTVCVGIARAQSAIEISKDGHAAAVPGFGPAFGWVARGSGVPFGTEPDQIVQLRRQIGGLAIADVNGDGRNDLVAVCYISQSFPPYEEWQDMIFYGNGAGIDTVPGWLSAVETHTGDVQIGDLNNDGLPDIVTIHGGGLRRDTVRVYTGQPGGPSTAAAYTSNTAATSWGTAGVLADIDQDGFDDLVTTNQGLAPDPFRPMLMFKNNAGTLTSAAVWQSAEQSIQNGVDATDLNGDGYPDLGVAKWVNFESAVYLNDAGTLSTTPAATVGTTGTDRGAAFADFDADGSLELAIGGSPTRVYAYDEGLLTPVAQTNPPFSGPQEVRAFDVDGDGRPDLGEVHFSDGRAHIYLNRGGVLDTTPSWSYDAPEVGTAMALGDLNGDGLPDLVVGYSGNTCIRVFFAIPQDCPADLDGNGELNFFDLSAFLALYNAQDPAADLVAPFGVFNFFDLSAYLDLYNAGCP